MTTGIYFVKSQDGKMYIGSAVNIEKRFHAHRYYLKLGQHASKRLQAAWGKFGSEGITFGVLEECSKDALGVREQYWVDLRKPAFNVRLEVGSNRGLKASKASRAKMSAARKAFLADPANLEAVREKTLRSWQDPEIAAKRISGMANAMTDEGKANIGAAAKARDAMRKAQKRRWDDPDARQRQSKKMAVVRAAKAPRTIDSLKNMAEERLLTCLAITGARRKDRMVLYCDSHGYTANKSVADFLAGQGCRHCGFERSSAVQAGKPVPDRGKGRRKVSDASP